MRIFNRKIHKSVAQDCTVEVTELDNMRNLHLGSDTIQSSMIVKDPFALALNYSRGIMCFLLFSSQIKTVLTIGLGGGSVTKYIYKYCPEIAQNVVEINTQVITVAKSHFYVPENDARLNLIEGDGVQYLLDNRASHDCVIIDGFDSHGIPENFCTQDFFDSCFEALKDNGIFVINLWGSDKNFDLYMHRIEQTFSDCVLMMPTGKPGNIIVFGFQNALRTTEKKLRERAKQLEKDHKIEFSEFLDKLQVHNSYDALQHALESK
ncbi:MAG: polyamine aminopropyltransferase [Methylophilaceae bacterium]